MLVALSILSLFLVLLVISAAVVSSRRDSNFDVAGSDIAQSLAIALLVFSGTPLLVMWIVYFTVRH